MKHYFNKLLTDRNDLIASFQKKLRSRCRGIVINPIVQTRSYALNNEHDQVPPTSAPVQKLMLNRVATKIFEGFAEALF